MKKVVATVAVTAAVAGAAVFALSQKSNTSFAQVSTPFSEEEKEFINFIAKHQKNYFSKEEYNYRLGIFAENYRFVQEHNAKDSSYKVAINHLSDLTPHEFKSFNLGYTADASYTEGATEMKLQANLKAPSSLDWRAKGAVTGVKNQGQCGSCWSFSTTGAMEGYHFLKTGSLVALSEQELMDCTWLKGNLGCNGGLMPRAFNWLKTQCLETETDYPYQAKSSWKCKEDKAKCVSSTTIKGYNSVPASADGMVQALQNGPVSIAIEADQKSFQQYSSGTFDGECGTKLDHGVLCVGYTSEYFIVKNSWGSAWGDNGYIKLARKSGSQGQCGMYMQASQPF